MTRGSWPGEKCDIVLTWSDYSTLPHLWEVWNLGWERNVGLFHTSTPLTSVELRMKKESSDLVAIAGHLWRSDQQNYDTGKLYHFKKNWGKWNGKFWDRFQNRSPWQVWATFWPSKSVAVSENRNPELFNSDFPLHDEAFFSLFYHCVWGTRTQPLICVGCSVHYRVSCAINKGGFFEIASSSSTHICLALRRLLTFCLTLTC